MSPLCLDFRLTVTGLLDAAAYRVELDSCVAGVNIATVASCRFDQAQLPHDTLRRLRAEKTGEFPLDLLVSLGNTLADLLLPTIIRDALLAHLLRFPTAPVHIRLKVAHRDLAALPWEYLRLEAAPGVPNGWLFLNDRITLRRECGSTPPLPTLPTNRLRVLIVWADPCSARFPALLHLSEEVRAIRAALRQQGVHNVTELRRATPESLRTDILALQPHLLHFIGHGRQRAAGDRLILSGTEPNSEASVTAEELAKWLTGTPIRLVTLAACDTLGAAQTLTACGVPAVVAMQLPLADDLAVPFAHNFYAALLQPCPVATALARSRNTLRGSGPAWGVPTLVESVESETLFAAPPQSEAPFYVPLPRNAEFVGHRALLAEMHRTLAVSESLPITLFGMGGQGKTQLAAEYAHCYREAYPGGIFWIKAATSQGILEELERIGRLHFAATEEMDALQTATYVREKLQNLAHPALLLYDNVAWESDATLVEKAEPELFLPVRGPCRVVVTTRDRLLSPPQARIFEQELMLERADALSLLTQGRTLPQDERREAERVLELTGALPLALVLAAHHITRSRSSFREYREHLEYSCIDTLTRSRRGFLSTTKHNGMIFNAIAISYCAQEPSRRYLLALMACFNRQSISPDLAFQASGFPNRMAFQEALADLTDCALLRRETDLRLTLHELVRVFVLGEQTPEILRPAADAVAGLLAGQMQHANETMQWHEIRRELPHCRAVTQMCQEYGASPPLIALLLAQSEYLSEHRELAEAAECCRTGIRLTADKAELRLPLAHFWRIYGEVQLADSKADADASVEKAFSIAVQAVGPENPEMWHFYNTRGLVHKRSRRASEALRCYEEAFRLCRQAFGGNDVRVALLLNNIAAFQEMKGDHDEALQNYNRSLAIYVAHYGSGHSKTAVRLNNIGRVLYALGRFEEALRHHAQARLIHAQTYHEGDLNVLMSRYYYAFACYSLNRIEEAQQEYDDAMYGIRAIYGGSHPSSLQLQDRWQRLIEGPAGE